MAAPDPAGFTLFVVATPIGNLGDLSERAARTLREVSLVVAEDTRRSRQLLSHLGIHARLLSLPAALEARRIPAVLDQLEMGSVALVTDAGTPAISDPGRRLVAAVRAAGHAVVPIPGPSAAVAALAASGLAGDRFCFLGFLPRTPSRLRRVLEAVPADWALVLYEAPQRLARTLELAAPTLAGRPVVVARELTKVHETWYHGTATELAERFAAVPPRGECTVVAGPREP
ncbi:MAG TPA: 16S rRNA (cytidine(1402)-2'-O)-methyltransferase [Candidatus Dormibacteraeota bacterium]|nr:16S rRNA (cytidine(1402)-2'-O)-methyltransferase [Candidatus Dormibacteraeota bacterium]